MQKLNFIIDFDSTFVEVESLETLAEIALSGKNNKNKILDRMRKITKGGMEGKIPFEKSLSSRIKLLQASKKDITQTIYFLKKRITPSIRRNREFFKRYKDQIYIISGGFKDYIEPVFSPYGIKSDHILANTFTFNSKDQIIGYDAKNDLSKSGGKVQKIKSLKLDGKVYVIGDGYTDYEIKKAGLADKFFVFVENIKRDIVTEQADYILPNFDEFLYIMDMPRAYSYPKNRIKVLLLENIHKNAYEAFNKEGYQVKSIPQSYEEQDLIEHLKEIHIVGIGSRTQITPNVLENTPRLLSVARFGIGTNNIDLRACAKKGVIVFNAPFSNTRSVVELVLGEIIMLYRRVYEKSEKLHKGVWDKSAKDCHEVRGKKLGILGYGNIGSQISVLAEMLGMEVYYYDILERLPLGKAKSCRSIKELLQIVDVVTLHMDGRKENAHLIGEEEFKVMKNGVIFINTARGHIVDVNALVKNIKSGKIIGAGLDVFPKEPKSNAEPFTSILQGMPNVILTPHIGGRSEEAQAHMGQFVPERVISFINTGNSTLSLNFPNLQLPELKDAHRLIHVHQNVPGVMAKINSLLANHKINIEGQYLKTNEDIGYVITDVNKTYDKDVIEKLKMMKETIKLRLLY
ncbi:3-phosphoglycerate dehydrogenase [Candidatus Gottesmanbacteria bacterium RIFCSPHIGHO2_01_FULL_39_10]|uniref:D-3-phosphoglycerate dehydrogenase n=1 Tax=Candidatus Gottesmanbacteria bacterium RIFCSPHIGHO2_01_FULL_39_10 TaxID=1798375 RepID=A0A1F5ZRR6_9BACT|nr:MAG: 3-phosphoglycerate dehydrogenase [Candidatus Gottesmanbacteria bacterium RIFCSPHIGHO2_01_FULL_39_10]